MRENLGVVNSNEQKNMRNGSSLKTMNTTKFIFTTCTNEHKQEAKKTKQKDKQSRVIFQRTIQVITKKQPKYKKIKLYC